MTKIYADTSHDPSLDTGMSMNARRAREGRGNLPMQRFRLRLKNSIRVTKLPPSLLKNAEAVPHPLSTDSSFPALAAPHHILLLKSDDFHFTF